MIARVATTTTSAGSCHLARDTGTELAVRSGGHSGAGHSSVDGGIVLDLRDMTALEIDPDEGTAWAETGLTAGDYTSIAGDLDVVTGFGDTGSVGIGGITLGGGIGFLVRAHGLTIDNLLAADVVTADGELVRTDAETDPDLFWAIRGRRRQLRRRHPVPLPRAAARADRRRHALPAGDRRGDRGLHGRGASRAPRALHDPATR